MTTPKDTFELIMNAQNHGAIATRTFGVNSIDLLITIGWDGDSEDTKTTLETWGVPQNVDELVGMFREFADLLEAHRDKIPVNE